MVNVDDSAIGYSVKLDFKRADFVRGIYNEAFSKLPKITSVGDMESGVPVKVIKVSEKPSTENIEIENGRAMNLHYSPSENEGVLISGLNIPNHDKHVDQNIYDEVSVSHKSIKVITDNDGYDAIG